MSNHAMHPRVHIDSRMNATTEICLNKFERLVKKDHKIRVGIELTFCDTRSTFLPLTFQFSL